MSLRRDSFVLIFRWPSCEASCPETASHRRLYAAAGSGIRSPLISTYVNGLVSWRQGCVFDTQSQSLDTDTLTFCSAIRLSSRTTACTVAVLPVPGTPEMSSAGFSKTPLRCCLSLSTHRYIRRCLPPAVPLLLATLLHTLPLGRAAFAHLAAPRHGAHALPLAMGL